MCRDFLTGSFLMVICLLLVSVNVQAGSRFSSNYPCSNAVKTCASSGTRTVEGFQVHRDCWEWAYTKKCNYPSNNDCGKHARCYSLGQRDCILRDSVGNCVNLKKEFSCKRWTPAVLESDTVRYGTEDKDGIEGLVCEGVPCMDGNCIDKSYQMDEDMVSSVAQLGALSQGKSDGVNFKIFEGQGRHCTKKPADYYNCCKVLPKGWGKNLGAKCSKDENILSEKRRVNLCVYAAKESKKTLGVTTLIKHHYCCFSNIIEKVVQVEARKQLGMSFSNGSSPDCRGLTLDELARVDFSKMDFSEFAAEVMQKVSIPNIEDTESRIHSAFKTTRRFNEERPALADNKLAGVNQSLIRPTAEEIRLEEERLASLEAERLKQEELARIEAERVETERLAKLEAKRLEQIRLKELASQQELAAKRHNLEQKIAEQQVKYNWASKESKRLGKSYNKAHRDPYKTQAGRVVLSRQCWKRYTEFNDTVLIPYHRELQRLKKELARLG